MSFPILYVIGATTLSVLLSACTCSDDTTEAAKPSAKEDGFIDDIEDPTELKCFRENNGDDNLNNIRVAMVLNEDSKLPSEEEIRQAFQIAGTELDRLTGKNLTLTERCYGRFGRFDLNDPSSSIGIARLMGVEYLGQTSTDFPDYIISITTDYLSSVRGGHRLGPPFGFFGEDRDFLAQKQPDFCQRASSKNYPNHPVIYQSVVRGISIFGGCGYDLGPDGEEVLARSTSQGGECVNTDGLECEIQNGVSLCPNLATDYRTSIPGMMAYLMNHELLHNFGLAGDNDHWGSPQCLFRVPECSMEESLTYFGMCPDIVENLSQAKPTCF